MRKLYYLSSCSTCMRIIDELEIPAEVVLQDIKNEHITESQIEEMKQLSGSYESLFSKRARLYKELGLKDKVLEEGDYKKYILQHYTFLKRPVLIYDGAIFIGNSKKVVETAKQTIHVQ